MADLKLSPLTQAMITAQQSGGQTVSPTSSYPAYNGSPDPGSSGPTIQGPQIQANLQAAKDKALASNADPLEATQTGVIPSLPGYSPKAILGNNENGPDILGTPKPPLPSLATQGNLPAGVNDLLSGSIIPQDADLSASKPTASVSSPTAPPTTPPPTTPPLAPSTALSSDSSTGAPALVPRVPVVGGAQKDFWGQLGDAMTGAQPFIHRLGNAMLMAGAQSQGQLGGLAGTSPDAMDLNRTVAIGNLQNSTNQIELSHSLAMQSLAQQKNISDADRTQRESAEIRSYNLQKQQLALQMAQLTRGYQNQGLELLNSQIPGAK